MQVARRFSITNFIIASSALCFQVFVLYPWHTKLDHDFEELKRENLRVLEEIRKEVRSERESTLGEIKKALSEKEGKRGWR